MRIAILDDNQLDIDYFKARAESFLKKKGRQNVPDFRIHFWCPSCG